MSGKVIAFFPEAAFGPALNSVGIAQACEKLGHKAVFLTDPGMQGVYSGYGFDEYTVNMINLVIDIRKEFKLPRLPVVIGELGNLGEKAGGGMVELRKAQAAAAASPKLGKGTVSFVKTTPFARPKELSPNIGHGHHWFGNAESYFLIGDALGRAMVKLLEKTETK